MKKILRDIRNLRNDYSSKSLDENSVSKNPFLQFEKWIKDAIDADMEEPNAMTLATVAENGYADARIVLLRDFSSKGFSFFTNYNSIKGREIRYNKKACLNFFWPSLSRQIRIRGVISRLSTKESDMYFQSRPRQSQLAAWASHQSELLNGRQELESRYKIFEQKFSKGEVPRPPHWGGFILKPVRIEFWQGRPSRLHDRIIYEKQRTSEWKIGRLNP